jgi:hypothetical protein
MAVGLLLLVLVVFVVGGCALSRDEDRSVAVSWPRGTDAKPLAKVGD